MANLALSRWNCVAVDTVGGPAVSAIETEASDLGIQCESFNSFSAWFDSPNLGFVNCNGSDAYDSYSLGNTAAKDASNAGW